MIEKSETIASLAKSLATAQGKFTAAKFDATNTFMKNKYASLGSIIETAKPILAENGLSVSQLMIGAGDHIGVTTVLLHSSGEWIESTVMLPVTEERGKSAAQAAGSVVTYLRRYALASILGIYADDDTDGQRTAEKKADTKPTATMDLETAKAVTTSQGVKYGEMDAKRLSAIIKSINKALTDNGLTSERREELTYKLDAAKTVFANLK